MMTEKEKQVIDAVGSATPEQLDAALRAISGFETQNPKDADGFLNLAAARRYAGNVSRTTFYRWVQSGMRCYRIRRRIMFRASDITDFILKTQGADK